MESLQDSSSPIKALNLVVAFLLEVALIVIFGYWGLHASHNTVLQWLFGIGAPLGAIMLWSILAAPKSARRLSRLPLAIFRIVIFTLAAICLLIVHKQTIGIAFEAISLLNIALLFMWRQ